MFGSLLGSRWWHMRIAWTLLLLFMKGTLHGQVEPCAFSIVDFCSRLTDVLGSGLVVAVGIVELVGM